MKTFKSILAVLTIALFAGCAGITEANLSDEQTFDAAGELPLIHQETPDFVNSGDREQMIRVRPTDSTEDRE